MSLDRPRAERVPRAGTSSVYLRIVAVAATLATVTGGCVARKTAVLYPLPARSSDQVAVVSGMDEQNGAVFIEAVDGVRLNEQPWHDYSLLFGPDRVNDVELLPGTHELEVSWIIGKGGRSVDNAVLKLDAEAGHRYTVHADEMRPSNAWTTVELFIAGGRSTWTAWITDGTSGAIVAGVRP